MNKSDRDELRKLWSNPKVSIKLQQVAQGTILPLLDALDERDKRIAELEGKLVAAEMTEPEMDDMFRAASRYLKEGNP